jgi:hypothetical protein
VILDVLEVLHGKVVQATAATGVAASLYRRAITLHSFAGIPVPFPEMDDVTSSISMEDPRAQKIISAEFLVVDEALSLNSKMLDLLQRTCRFFRKIEKPFGGLVLLFCGDPRQTLAVLRNATTSDQIDHVISNCEFFPIVQRMELTQNLRVRNSPETAVFAEMVLNYGDGKVPVIDDRNRVEGAPKDSVQIPTQYLLNPYAPDPIASMIDFVYDGLSENYKSDPHFFRDRAIVTPLNVDVHMINEKVLVRLPEPVSEFFAVDELDEEDNATIWTPELMAALELPGIPQFKLQTKPFAIVMLLRNMSLRDGLVNGTRMQVLNTRRLNKMVMQCRILTGAAAGTEVFIPRVSLEPTTSGLPFTFKRRQFPLRLCFAMTINKSQGQGFLRLCAYLASPVFSHGQLYVALSRLIDALGLMILIIPGTAQGRMHSSDASVNWTRNVVLKDIFKTLRGEPVNKQVKDHCRKYTMERIHFMDIIAGTKTVEVRLCSSVCAIKTNGPWTLNCGDQYINVFVRRKKIYVVKHEHQVESVLRTLLGHQKLINTLPHATSIELAIDVYLKPNGFWDPKTVVKCGGFAALWIEYIAPRPTPSPCHKRSRTGSSRPATSTVKFITNTPSTVPVAVGSLVCSVISDDDCPPADDRSAPAATVSSASSVSSSSSTSSTALSARRSLSSKSAASSSASSSEVHELSSDDEEELQSVDQAAEDAIRISDGLSLRSTLHNATRIRMFTATEDELFTEFMRRTYVEPVLSRFKIDIGVRDLQTLKGVRWLNDQVINMGFHLIEQCSKLPFSPTKTIVYPIGFFQIMQTRGYQSVKNYGYKKVKLWYNKNPEGQSKTIFDFDFLFIPVFMPVSKRYISRTYYHLLYFGLTSFSTVALDSYCGRFSCTYYHVLRQSLQRCSRPYIPYTRSAVYKRLSAR